MTLATWAIAAMVLAVLIVGRGGVFVDLGHRLILFGGEILFALRDLIGG